MILSQSPSVAIKQQHAMSSVGKVSTVSCNQRLPFLTEKGKQGAQRRRRLSRRPSDKIKYSHASTLISNQILCAITHLVATTFSVGVMTGPWLSHYLAESYVLR